MVPPPLPIPLPMQILQVHLDRCTPDRESPFCPPPLTSSSVLLCRSPDVGRWQTAQHAYISNTSHTLHRTLQTHGLRHNSSQNVSGREGINCCRRFYVLLFLNVSSICRRYERSSSRLGSRHIVQLTTRAATLFSQKFF